MARTLNGSSQYLTVSSGLSLGANDPVWISMWGYRNNSSANYCYFSLGVSGSGVNRKFVSGSTTISATTTNNAGTGAAATSANSPTNATWFHILAEFGGAADRKITIHGGTTAPNTTSNSLSVAPNILRVGATPSTTALLAGRVAYVGVFSGAPSAQDYIDLSGLGVEADALHPTLCGSAGNLLAYWDLDGTDSPEPDGIGSNDLTLVATPGSAASPLIQLAGSPQIILPHGGWW
jgi:hypothetical protein